MENDLDFKNDFFFKYYAGRNVESSLTLRAFLIRHVLNRDIGDVRTDNPYLFVIKDGDKEIQLDTFMSSGLMRCGIEMQNTSLTTYLYKRFQYYSFKAVVTQMMNGERNYDKLMEYHQIIFINDLNKDYSELITHASIKYEDGRTMNDCIVYIHFVNLKYVKRLAKEKSVLSEFEAVIYLIAENTLAGIEYEEKEGMIKNMERSYESFRSDKGLMTMMRSKEEEEKFRQMEMELAKAEGEEKGRGEGQTEILRQLILSKYQEDASEWLKQCTGEQIQKLISLIVQNIDYQELQERMLSLI